MQIKDKDVALMRVPLPSRGRGGHGGRVAASRVSYVSGVTAQRLKTARRRRCRTALPLKNRTANVVEGRSSLSLRGRNQRSW